MCTVLLPPDGYPITVKYIISYHIISYHIISYHIISYHIISYHIISYHIISYHNISYIISYIISYHIYHIISYHISYIIYHIISYHISYIIYHIISYHIYHIIYHIISYHIISYHIISYHIIILKECWINTCFRTSHRKRTVPSCWPAGPQNMHAVLTVIATILYKTADVIIPLHTLHILSCEARTGKHYKGTVVVAYFNLRHQCLPRRIYKNRHSRYTTAIRARAFLNTKQEYQKTRPRYSVTCRCLGNDS